MLAVKPVNAGLLVFVVGTLVGPVSVAKGAGFQLLEQNASGLGNAYAGQAAAAENASAIFYNPASMTLLPGTQFSGSVLVLRLSAEFRDSGGSVAPNGAGVPAGGSDGGNAGGDLIYLPSLFLTRQISPDLWLGVGVSAPFGLRSQYDADFIGRFQSQKAVLKTYDINPSIAYRVSESISFGAGLSYQRVSFKLDRSAFVGAEVPSNLDLSSSAWGWNAGLLLTPAHGTRVGLSYRSSIEHDLSGTVNVFGVAGFPASASANLRLPATSSVALTQELSEKLQVLGDFTYTNWSSIKAVPVVLASGAVADTFNLQFRDGWRIGAGANYKWSQDFMLKFGIAYERSPVTGQYRTTAIPDANRFWVGVGGKYAISKRATVDFGYAHAFAPDATINQQRGVGTPLAQGNVIGDYKLSIDLLGLQYSYAF